MTKSTVDWQLLPLPDENQAITFDFVDTSLSPPQLEPAFLIRHAGHLYVYHNRCPHAGTTLDWNPGHFFSDDRRFLLCQTHGALFDPATGAPMTGPCRFGLQPLPFRLLDGMIAVPRTLHLPDGDLPWPTD